MTRDRPFSDYANRKQHMPWTLPGWVPLVKRVPLRAEESPQKQEEANHAE